MRNFFIKIAIFLRYMMRGLHSADVEAFEGKTQESKDGINAEQQEETNNVYKNLLKGEVTQAVKELRYEMYQAERKSYEYQYSGGGYCQKKEKTIPLHIAIEDDESIFLIQTNKENTSTINDYNIVWDGGINHKIDNNKDYGERLLHSYTINIERDFLPRYKIEEFTYRLVVKKKNDKFVLDFYTPFYKDPYNKRLSMFIKEIEKIKNGDKQNDIIDFNTVTFITDNAYGADNLKEYSFTDFVFRNVIEYEGYYIVQFYANMIKNEDLTDEFYDEIADMKNKNHEMREGATLSLNDVMTKNERENLDMNKACELVEKIK